MRPERAPWSLRLPRDAAGAETERKLPGGVVARWDHDTSGRPAVQQVAQRDAQVLRREYTWRSNEQIAAIEDAQRGVTRYEHDRRSYLVAALRPDGTTQHRTPDPAGNLFRTPDRSDRVYGRGGVLKKADDVSYTHDADGNMTEKVLPDGQKWIYQWDGVGQLREVVRPDGQVVSFAYDALGRRVRKTSGGRTTAYVWDGNDVVHEVQAGSGVTTWEFEPETFAPLAKIEGNQRYGVVTDHLGTPLAMFDEAGEIAWKAQLDVYGAAQTDVMRTPCPWRWPGQYEDEETGLFYNRCRYYDPLSQRYISCDPIGLSGGARPYRYPFNPFVQSDPLGLKCKVHPPQPDWLSKGVHVEASNGVEVMLRGVNGKLALDLLGKPSKGKAKEALREVSKYLKTGEGISRVREVAQEGIKHFANNPELVSRIQAVLDCF